MFPTSIPHFKDVIIMSNACDACGYRDSEIKPGGGFSEKGQSITLQVRIRIAKQLWQASGTASGTGMKTVYVLMPCAMAAGALKCRLQWCFVASSARTADGNPLMPCPVSGPSFCKCSSIRIVSKQVTEQEDLSRDVIKSDTAEISIPELDLHITTGSLGGLITTVEGLATSVQVCFAALPHLCSVLSKPQHHHRLIATVEGLATNVQVCCCTWTAIGWCSVAKFLFGQCGHKADPLRLSGINDLLGRFQDDLLNGLRFSVYAGLVQAHAQLQPGRQRRPGAEGALHGVLRPPGQVCAPRRALDRRHQVRMLSAHTVCTAVLAVSCVQQLAVPL